MKVRSCQFFIQKKYHLNEAQLHVCMVSHKARRFKRVTGTVSVTSGKRLANCETFNRPEDELHDLLSLSQQFQYLISTGHCATLRLN